jgi:HNH endonuclease
MAYIKREKLINHSSFYHGITKTLKERFLEKLSKKDKNGCINWKGNFASTGGHAIIGFIINGKSYTYKAHRLSYQFFKGEIPRKKFVLHSCNNVKCVNPEHLRVGTQKENVRDRIKDETDNKGERHGMSKLTEAKVKKIRKMKKLKMNAATIGAHFNVSEWTIYDVLNKRRWSHVL